MTRTQTSEQVNEYRLLCRELNIEYEEYARSLGMSYSSLFVLGIICFHANGCTQKTICDESYLPKQTVNAIITGFLKHGLVKLVEVNSDRRRKTIHLTESGLEYANSVLQKIKKAEDNAMDSLDNIQRETLLETTRLFISRFHTFLRG